METRRKEQVIAFTWLRVGQDVIGARSAPKSSLNAAPAHPRYNLLFASCFHCVFA
jgi:hypothetical protein